MNRFSDAGSTPAVSIKNSHATRRGLFFVLREGEPAIKFIGLRKAPSLMGAVYHPLSFDVQANQIA